MATTKYTDIELYRRLLQLAKPYWFHIAGYFLLGLLASPLALLAPLPLKIAIDSAIGPHPLPRAVAIFLPASAANSRQAALILAAVMMIVIALLDRLQAMGVTVLGSYTGEKLLQGFRGQIFRHLQRLSISYHDMEGTADSIYRIQNDAAAIKYISIDGAIPFLTALISVAIMLYVTLRIDWQLALVALVVSPILYFLSRMYRLRLRKRSREVKRLESSIFAVVQEVLTAIRVVKAFGKEDNERDRFLGRSGDHLRARIHLALLESRYSLLVGLTTAVGTSVVLWIGVQHVQTGLLYTGSLIMMMSYLAQLYGPLKTIGTKASSLQAHLAGAERAFSVLDRLPDVAERVGALPLVRAKGAVAFSGVSFAYDGTNPVVRDITFEIPPGARVGIAGRTGAGKTSLLSLLTRFYDPTSGQILLDGCDLREYKLTDLRNQFAIVLQEPVLFSTSIAENIAYGRPGASEEEIVTAAKLANAHDFIAALPQGYLTTVGERGMRLSGGERQRISLARAYLKDAPILLLDEPTSSVDTGTETLIMAAVERLMQGRTTFIIAHRLSTLESCDIRLDLENGGVVSLRSGAIQSNQPEKTGVGAGN
jgi:ATP-binding cassette subfamily B protein